MAVENGGFEGGGTGWFLTGSAEVVEGLAHSGTHSCLLIGMSGEVLGQPIRIDSSAEQYGIAVPDGALCTVGAWVCGTGDPNCPLELQADVGAGWETVQAISNPPGEGVWVQLSGSLLASSDVAKVRFVVEVPAFETSVAWYVDDVTLEAEEDDVALTGRIRSALLADLAAVTTENGFEATLKEVYANPVSMEKAVFPCALVGKPFGGVSDPDELGNRVGVRTYAFPIQVWVKSSTPFEDLDALLDAVSNAIERSDSEILKIDSVHQVDVVEFDSTGTSNEGSGSLVDFVELTVRVIAHYLRGAA